MRSADVEAGQVYQNSERWGSYPCLLVVTLAPIYTQRTRQGLTESLEPATSAERVGKHKVGRFTDRTGFLAVALDADLHQHLRTRARTDPTYRPGADPIVIDLLTQARMLRPLIGPPPALVGIDGRHHAVMVAIPRYLEGELAATIRELDAHTLDQQEAIERRLAADAAARARFAAINRRATALGVSLTFGGIASYDRPLIEINDLDSLLALAEIGMSHRKETS